MSKFKQPEETDFEKVKELYKDVAAASENKLRVKSMPEGEYVCVVRGITNNTSNNTSTVVEAVLKKNWDKNSEDEIEGQEMSCYGWPFGKGDKLYRAIAAGTLFSCTATELDEMIVRKGGEIQYDVDEKGKKTPRKFTPMDYTVNTY